MTVDAIDLIQTVGLGVLALLVIWQAVRQDALHQRLVAVEEQRMEDGTESA